MNLVRFLLIATIFQLIIMGSFADRRSINQLSPRLKCSEDYSPCKCNPGSITTNGHDTLLCEDVSMEDIMDVFNRSNSPIFFELLLRFHPSDEQEIPNHLIDDKMINQLTIDCRITNNNSSSLKIANNAFESTKSFTAFLQLLNCDLSELNFEFLRGFDTLESISIDSSTAIANSLFTTLPPFLTSLKILQISRCSGWKHFVLGQPMEGVELASFSLYDSIDMNDEFMSFILDWVVQSFNSTLSNLNIYGNSLTKIPSKQFDSFSQLNSINLKNNFIQFVASSSILLKESEMNTYVVMSNCRIESIEADAFQGWFDSETLIDLRQNDLTRFESSVFHKVLESGASVDVYQNPFDCDDDPCHLAWILNDPPLLNLVLNAKCSNGTPFDELNQAVIMETCSITTSTQDYTSIDVSSTFSLMTITNSIKTSSSSVISSKISETSLRTLTNTIPNTSREPSLFQTTITIESFSTGTETTKGSLFSTFPSSSSVVAIHYGHNSTLLFSYLLLLMLIMY